MTNGRKALIAAKFAVRAGVVGAFLLAADLWYAARAHRPAVQRLLREQPDTTAYMRSAAETGHPVRAVRWVPLARIAPIAACAAVVAEDEEYFDKGTVSWKAQRVLLSRMLRGDFSRGGSGLSQQLARNLFLAPKRTPQRKLREYALAYELSSALPKGRLLELYLNVVEWGDGIWGIEAASRHYVGVAAAELTASQAVVLASYLPAPRRELQYVLGPLATQRQAAIARKLWLARLLDDPGYGSVQERVQEWRTQARQLGSARAAWGAVDALMGREGASAAASPSTPGALPLARLCNVRRRGL